MAEITRHRLSSFAIESQRYVCMKGEIDFIQPECFISGDTASAIWRIAMGEAERTYHKLLECGWLSQDARKVLPNSTATKIVTKANLREWRHIFALRTSPAAYPEIRA